jgi:hypothetical protein
MNKSPTLQCSRKLVVTNGSGGKSVVSFLKEQRKTQNYCDREPCHYPTRHRMVILALQYCGRNRRENRSSGKGREVAKEPVAELLVESEECVGLERPPKRHQHNAFQGQASGKYSKANGCRTGECIYHTRYS